MARPQRYSTRGSIPPSPHIHALPDPNRTGLEHATRVITNVCRLAGALALIDDLRGEAAGGIPSIIERNDNAALYDWLIDAASYQGISDQVAYAYMEMYGRVTWSKVKKGLRAGPSCPKLQSYWHFADCRYDKQSGTCAEPDHAATCPLPRHILRNGRLNQTAYSLYLFVRDITDGDLIGWIDRRLSQFASTTEDPGWVRAALIEPLRNVYGVSDKVLMMALSCILIGAPPTRPLWFRAGIDMVAIDTLVHNFLHRTGILRMFEADHSYGVACYQPGGCADIIYRVAQSIDARRFNPDFPQVFPRFVQHAIWRYCAQQGLNICNGNRIKAGKPCRNLHCQIYAICEHVSL